MPICSCLAWRHGYQSWVLLLYDINLPQMFVGMWLDVDLCVWDSPKLSVKAILVNAGCRELDRETVAGCPGGTPGCPSSGWGDYTNHPSVSHHLRFHTSSLAHKGQEPWPRTAWCRLEKGLLCGFSLCAVPLLVALEALLPGCTPRSLAALLNLAPLLHNGFWPY